MAEDPLKSEPNKDLKDGSSLFCSYNDDTLEIPSFLAVQG